jgi:7-cyano-7-deazaguanine synthase
MSELLLLSGGIDSMALAVWRRPTRCLTIDYGQRPARSEIAAAAQLCQVLGLRHEILQIPIGILGAGVLAGTEAVSSSPHPEFWPFRNQLLITVGAMAAVRDGLTTVLIGTVRSDRRHVDGSPRFIEAMTAILEQQEGSIALEAPAIGLTSLELVLASGISIDLLGWAHSCHAADLACGNCPGCAKHSDTMQALGWDR